MKRGQLTVFIIIGLVLILTIGTVIYFTQRQATAPLPEVSVPEETEPIYDYVTTCTSQIGKDGLQLLGAQGGYIELPPKIDLNPNAHLNADPFGVAKIPYWYYAGEDRSPSETFMRRELERYIAQELPGCINNFEAFSQQYTVVEKTEPRPIVTFTEDNVIIELNWALDIIQQGKVNQLTQFATTHPLKLKSIWELADNTMQTENQQGWLENLTIDLIAINPDIPLNGMEFRCAPRKWHLQQVRQELQRTLHYLLPLVRVQNTQYAPPLESQNVYESLRQDAERARERLAAGRTPDWPDDAPSDAFQVNRMTFDANQPETPLKAAFVHEQNWPILVNAQPSQGGVLSSAQIKGPQKYLRFLCINQWHFAYDVIYPVKMIIRDDTAFQGEGYTFQFAFPVIIEDNEERRQFFGMERFETPPEAQDFCTAYSDQSLDIRAYGFIEGSPVAEELDGVNVTYRCASQECLLGETYSDGTGAIRLTSYLPEGCSNPTIIAQKEGYLPAERQATQDRIDLVLTKLKRMNYTIMLHPYTETLDRDNPTIASNEQWLDAQTHSTFTANMHATIAITVRNTTYEQYKNYPPELTTPRGEQVEAVEDNTINFVWDDAAYDIDILLLKDDTPIGGYHAENLTIPFEDVASATNAIFHSVEYRPLPVEDYQQAGMFFFLYERGKKNNQSYQEALRPTFT